MIEARTDYQKKSSPPTFLTPNTRFHLDFTGIYSGMKCCWYGLSMTRDGAFFGVYTWVGIVLFLLIGVPAFLYIVIPREKWH